MLTEKIKTLAADLDNDQRNDLISAFRVIADLQRLGDFDTAKSVAEQAIAALVETLDEEEDDEIED